MCGREREREQVCVCVYVCACVRTVAYCIREEEKERQGVFSGSVFSSKCTSAPLPVFIIVPVCSGVPLPPHPFIQMQRKITGDEEEEAIRLFPSGGKKHK